MTVDDLLELAPVIPVLVLDDVGTARETAEALVAGGLPVIEVTLRTSAALDIVAAMAAVDGAVVGAGTVVNAEQVEAAAAAGARFLVSPGLTDPVAGAAAANGLPYLPGVATAADIMRGLDLGLTRFKFFPAVPAGGLPLLRAFAAPFGGVRFCPTGGITQATAPEWLAEPAVACVGGSWIVPRDRHDPAAIRTAATAAAALPR